MKMAVFMDRYAKQPTFYVEPDFVGCEPVGPIPLDSFVNYIDKKKSSLFRNCSFRVPSGIRTHDIQNHNLTL